MASGTNKQKVAGQRRTLKALKQKIQGMAEMWADEDEYNSSILHELAAQCDEASKCLSGEG